MQGKLLPRSHLLAQQQSLRPCLCIRNLLLHSLCSAIPDFDRTLLLVRSAPQRPIEGAIHRNALDPRPKPGPELKRRQPLIPAQEGLLHHLIRVRLIAGDAKGNPKQRRTMPNYQRPICLGISGKDSPDRAVLVELHSAN
jgi:hypothetical protein